MPKTTPRPEYGNQQITALIKEHIHDKNDRRMLYLRLVDGMKIQDIANEMKLDKSTVWIHLKAGEKELFSHIPYESDGE